MTSSVLLKTAKVIVVEPPYNEKLNQGLSLSGCSLKWKKKRLWVQKTDASSLSELPALNNEEWLKNCLKHSNIKQVCLDFQLGEKVITTWANLAHQANKAIFIRVPSYSHMFVKQKQPTWLLKRLLDWLMALILLIVLSPIILGLMVLVKLSSPGPIFYRQWRIGQRGKLFQIWKFRTMIAEAEASHHQVMINHSGLHKCLKDPRITNVGHWMRKYSLDELPQLGNVLKGEMTLVGPRPWALYDALRLEQPLRKRLNALPGITGAWQVSVRSYLLDLNKVNQIDLDYLSHWSLFKDFRILLLTIPRVLSGFGAY